MKKYIHIGFPKNFSTSLQRDYFSKNQEVFHLGVGLNNNLGYFDDTINKIFEVYLKTCKTFQFEKHKVSLRNHVESIYAKAKESNGVKAFGASSEHLSFAFTYDGLSADVKAKRLSELFGKDTTIIMVLRNQIDLIKSLFKESVRVGFKGDFDYYLYLFYKYQDRNYYSDINYDWVYQQYINHFGSDNVKVLFFENYRKNGNLIIGENNSPLMFNHLDKILEVNTLSEFGHYNEALSEREIGNKIRLNQIFSHDLGNHLYESAEKHRIKQYLESDLNLFEKEETTFEDVITKRELIARSQQESFLEVGKDFKLPSKLISRIVDELKNSNRNLENLLKDSLPSEYDKLDCIYEF